jgi:hypothetical protein
MAARSPIEPVGVGYDVDENAVRFSNYFHVLRELVHLSCGWLPLEPRLETKQDAWEKIIAAHADRADYIVQEYVPVPEEMFPTVEDGHVQMRLKRFNINPFGIGGRYAGSITRISDRAVINVSAGGGLLPSVIGRHKRRLLAEDEDESEVLDGQKP